MAFGEAARAVVEQDPVLERPVAALRKHDVEVAVPVKIAETRVRAGLGSALEGDNQHVLGVRARRGEQQSAEEGDRAGGARDPSQAAPTLKLHGRDSFFQGKGGSIRYSARRFGPMSTSVTWMLRPAPARTPITPSSATRSPGSSAICASFR